MRLLVVISSFNAKTREFDGIWRECWHRLNPGVPLPGAHLHFGGPSWALHVLDGTCSSYFNEAQCAWRFDRIEAAIKEIVCQHASCQFQGLGLLHSDDPKDRAAFVKLLPDPFCWTGHNYSSALGGAYGTYTAFILPFKETDCIETAFCRLWGHLVADEEFPLPAADANTNAKCHLQGLEHGLEISIGRISHKLSSAEKDFAVVAVSEVLRYVVNCEIPILEERLTTTVTATINHTVFSRVANTIIRELTPQIHRLEAANGSGAKPEVQIAACRDYLNWLSAVRRHLKGNLEETL